LQAAISEKGKGAKDDKNTTWDFKDKKGKASLLEVWKGYLSIR
jgi:hypothetical protein